MKTACGKTDIPSVPPISGSMKPLIRPHIDSAVFVPPEHIRKYDVVLYRRNGQAIMHRVISISGDTCFIRGDNSNYTEKVPLRDIFGVMRGFYRGKRYVNVKNCVYLAYICKSIRLMTGLRLPCQCRGANAPVIAPSRVHRPLYHSSPD